MGQKKQLLWGTIILTATGFLSRLIGFFYRIFLSHTIGAEGLGIYQLVFPVQALCLALTVMGMSTAISRFVASRFAVKDLKGAHDIFLVGTGVSVLFACLVSWVIRENASFLSSVFLGEPRTESLLCLMSWSLPLCALHNCINGYFYAQKKTGIPAASQLLEQFVRVATAYLAYSFLLSRGQEPTAWIAVIGIFTSELCVVLFCLFFLLWNHQKSKLLLFPIQEPFGHLRRLGNVPPSNYEPPNHDLSRICGGYLNPLPAADLRLYLLHSFKHLWCSHWNGFAYDLIPQCCDQFYLCNAASLHRSATSSRAEKANPKNH